MSNLFSIGTSALLANQQALATTGNNIANANTEGYSRQRVDFQERHVAGTRLGQGVEAGSISRISDPFANQRVVQSNTEHAALDTEATLARRLDAVLSDPQTGLAEPLRGFIDAVDALAADPTAVEARLEVLGEAEALAQRFSQIQGAINNLNVELNGRTATSVDEINNLTSAIAQLNEEIARSQGTGTPNALLDERDRLITELSGQIDVSTAIQDDGSVNVFVGNGQSLVVGSQVTALEAVPGATPADATRVLLGGGDISQQISGGELGGIFGFRRDVLAPAQQQLTDLSATIASAVNAGQAGGTDLNGNAGQDLFATAPDGAGLTVLISDPAELAAAGAGAPAGSGDNSNALSLAETLRGPLLGPNSVQEANISLVGRVGAQTRQLEAAETAQAAVLARQQSLRDAVSGVNLDEEAADLLRFQQSYQAAAQIIATANAMFEALIAATR